MAEPPTVVIVGAGIGGLTAACALAAKGLRPVVLEQAETLEETGAGIQLSPNATRILHALGLAPHLLPSIVVPEAVRVRSHHGREIVRIPLGATVQRRCGAPYWLLHRADLQAALVNAARAEPNIVLRLGTRVADFAVHAKGVTVRFHTANGPGEEHAIALIGADGLWSTVRAVLGDRRPPRFARRSAWRAMLPTKMLLPEFREPTVSLWLGPDAHLVLYPVKAGHVLNIVAVIKDDWREPGWSGTGAPEQLLAHFAGWPPLVHNLLGLPDRWLKWALFDRLPLYRRGSGAVALLGDAAHPMLSFLAQGAAMAIEDAYVLAERLAASPDEPEKALRQYERRRRRRTARVQRTAARNGRIYHLRGIAAFLRNRALRVRGGFGLLRRYDWLYRWHP